MVESPDSGEDLDRTAIEHMTGVPVGLESLDLACDLGVA
jgi:hypothetical protein